MSFLLTFSTLERRQDIVPPAPAKSKTPPDMEFYVTIAENAKRRAEQLERDNLEVGPLRTS